MEEIKKKLPYEKPQIACIVISSDDILNMSGGNDIGEDLGLNDGIWL